MKTVRASVWLAVGVVAAYGVIHAAQQVIAGLDGGSIARAFLTDTSGRLNMVGAAAAAAAIAGNPVAVGYSDGTNAQYAKSASASSLSAAIQSGSGLSEKGPRWSVVSTPGAGNQATASKAAGAAGVRHVADCVSLSAFAGVAPALTGTVVNLRDGATGAGTILYTQAVIFTVGVGQDAAPFTACGLNLIGTAATAMTLEFSVGVANASQTVTITGYDVQ